MDEPAADIAIPIGLIEDLALGRCAVTLAKAVSYWVPRMTHADRSSLSVWEGECLRVISTVDSDPASVDVVLGTNTTYMPNDTLVGRVFTSRRPIRCDEIRGNSLHDLRILSRAGLRSALVVPLIHDNVCLGTLNCSSRQPGALTARCERVLSAVAAWVAMQITVHKQAEALDQLAHTDSLTGLPNRRDYMRRAAAAHARGRPSVALMVIDLDRFKQINDQHGHGGGDTMLRACGTIMQRLVPPDGAVARIGGEEFAVLMDNTSPTEAAMLADGLCRAIGDLRVEHDGRVISGTASIGIAVRQPGDVTVETLLGRADAALYQAKRDGRNRIVLADEIAGVAGSDVRLRG